MRANKYKISFLPLSAKLILCYLLLAAGMFAFLNTWGVEKLRSELLEKEEERLYDVCSSLSGSLPDTISVTVLTDSTTWLESAAMLGNCRLWVADSYGTICFDSGTPDRTGASIPDHAKEFLSQTTISNTDIGELLFYPACAAIYPLTNDFQTTGYLVALSPCSHVTAESVLFLDVYNLCFLFYCIFLAVIFLAIYAITVRPLKKNILAVQAYSSRNYDYPANIHTRDEYEELAETTAFLAKELKNLEDYQKKFVANISHDLRSPLTSIKGYAEAMADGTIPAELQEKYLNIIIYETTRLTKLSQNLLALNSYENHGAMLNLSTFDINAAIRQISLSFEGTGRQKNIRIHLLFEEASLFVSADMEKIQQVLYNLLDNAIKFSYENKTIRIMTKTKGTKAMISIKDTGVGIPKEALNKVFDRFYKTDSSRGRDKKGTGLGLAIVKEILSAHKEHITVVSTEGAGTEFTFSLPLGSKGQSGIPPS